MTTPSRRRLLEATLTKWGYEVLVAKDGREAWDILEGDGSPKMAILDWLMPEMDGLEVCRKVREREQEMETPYVYIIMLTSKVRKEDVVEGMDAGADDYLTKPFNQNELQVRMMAGQRILDLQAVLFQSLTRHKRAEEELARARKREVGIGAKIQQTLLLGQPPKNLTGMRVGALTIPSQQIDGDFYDFFQHTDTCLDVVVGDVMGKGVPAALLGAAIKSPPAARPGPPHRGVARDRGRARPPAGAGGHRGLGPQGSDRAVHRPGHLRDPVLLPH